MKKPCVLFLAAAIIASSCGTSGGNTTAGSADGTPPATDAAVTTTPPQETPPSQPPPSEPVASEPVPSDPVAETAPPVTDPPISSDPVSISSDDGDLTVTLPGDVAAELGVSIRLLDSSELPPEVAGGDNLDSVKVYELEPDGTTFDAPVTITRRLDVSAFDALELGPGDVPFVTLLNRDASGKYELLDDLTMTRLGNDLYMSGTTTHFSSFVAGNEGVAIRDSSTPAGVGLLTFAENDEFQRSVDVPDLSMGLNGSYRLVLGPIPDSHFEDYMNRHLPLKSSDQNVPDGEATPAWFTLQFGETPTPVEPPMVSTERSAITAGEDLTFGSQSSMFYVPIQNAPSAWALTEENPDQPERIEFTVRSLFGSAPASAFPQPFLAGLEIDISVAVNHTPFESYSALELFASFLRALFEGLDELPPEARVYMGLIESGSFDGGTRVVDLRPIDVLLDLLMTLDLGIECFCDYEFVLFYLDAADELAEAALLEAETLEEAFAIVETLENIGRLVLEESPDEPFVAGVTADEGSLADDVAVIVELFAG